MAGVQANVTALEARLGAEITGLQREMKSLESRIEARVSAQELRLIKWMVANSVAVAGLVVAALRLFGQGSAP